MTLCEFEARKCMERICDAGGQSRLCECEIKVEKYVNSTLYLPEHENELPDDDLLQNGYNNFTLVEIKIHSIEWLYLHRQGHRRALFTSTNGSLNKEWLTP